MSEENVQETTEPTTEVTETETVETNKSKLEELERDDLVNIIRDLRRENAKTRTEKQATKKELEEFQAWKDSQKTELERAQEEASRLKEEKLTLLRTNAALSFGLDEDVAEFVKGDTEDEIKASAKKLAEKLGTNEEALARVAGKTPVTDVFAGNRGVPVSKSTDVKTQANEFISGLIFGQGR